MGILLEKSIMDGVYVFFIHLEHHLFFSFYLYMLLELYLMVQTFIIQILGFQNCSFLTLNGYSIYGLCITLGTNEFLGGYSNYKFIISFSMFSRMDLWRILCLQSNYEEVLSFSFSTPISSLWFCNSSSFLSSFSFF